MSFQPWVPGIPDGQDPVNESDNKIRNNNTAFQQRFEREHYFPSNDDQSIAGRHKFPGGGLTERNALPNVTLGMIFARHVDLKCMSYFDLATGTGWMELIGYGFGTEAERDALDTASLPLGYLWANTDARSVDAWAGTGQGWIPAAAAGFAATTENEVTAPDTQASPYNTDIQVASGSVVVPTDGNLYDVVIEAQVQVDLSGGSSFPGDCWYELRFPGVPDEVRAYWNPSGAAGAQYIQPSQLRILAPNATGTVDWELWMRQDPASQFSGAFFFLRSIRVREQLRFRGAP